MIPPAHRFAAFAALLALPSCGGGMNVTPQPDLAEDTAIHLGMTYSLGAGQEQHLCQFSRLPQGSGGELLVSGESHDYTLGHHWALLRTSVTALPAGFQLDTPVDCFSSGIGQYAESALFLDQDAQGSFDFPAGTALPFQAGELVMLELHGLNATQAEASGKLDVTLATTTAAEVQNRLGLIQFYDPFIYVPAMASASAHMRCRIPQDITLIAATTHFHLRGVDEKVFVDLAGQAPATAPLVESTDWQHPNQWRGELKIPAGSSVHFGCAYANGDPQPYVQGQDKLGNEMCMTIGFYYPVIDAPFEGCFADGEASELGTGTVACGATTQCIQSCPPAEAPRPNGAISVDVGPCFQKCVVDSCPSATAPLLAESACIQKHCATECSTGGDCPACVLQNCADEYSTCMTHSCP